MSGLCAVVLGGGGCLALVRPGYVVKRGVIGAGVCWIECVEGWASGVDRRSTMEGFVSTETSMACNRLSRKAYPLQLGGRAFFLPGGGLDWIG